MVVLPLGISVSTMSSGYSINCRMTNSRNSLMTMLKVFQTQSLSLARCSRSALSPCGVDHAVSVSAVRGGDNILQVCVGSSAAVSATAGSGCDGVVSAGADGAVASDAACAAPLVARFLFFLIKLRTVSDACAPLLIQYSARSSFKVVL